MHSMYRNIKYLTQCYLSNSKYVYPVYSRNYVINSANEQFEILNSALGNNVDDWSALKSNILCKQGAVNEKNVDAVIMKTMVRNKKLELALSFVNHLMKNSNLNIGVRNGILSLYYEVGKQNPLSEVQKEFILSTYKDLYEKYTILDFSTAETLLHALCAIDDWKKALKVLEDIQTSGTPSHSAFSTLIATLFRNNKEKDAYLIIQKSVSELRPLQFIAYKEWIEYFFRKYKSKATILKHLDKINEHICINCVVISRETAEHLRNTYKSLGWSSAFTEIKKYSGECTSCTKTLQNLKLSNEEFELLEKNIKDKLIVGSDLFLKTSPKELNAFLNFLERTAPYDVVLDALNIAYAMGKSSHAQKMYLLKTVVDYFSKKNKKVLLLGRKHMINWHKPTLNSITSTTLNFFTDDISQDDPFFITAAIVSGPHTDIVSKDLLRGHRFVLKDHILKQLFQRWQWQHQWMVYLKGKRPSIQPPLQFTPCAQKSLHGWHLPYEKEIVSEEEKFFKHDGIPDYGSWLCIRPNVVDSPKNK